MKWVSLHSFLPPPISFFSPHYFTPSHSSDLQRLNNGAQSRPHPLIPPLRNLHLLPPPPRGRHFSYRPLPGIHFLPPLHRHLWLIRHFIDARSVPRLGQGRSPTRRCLGSILGVAGRSPGCHSFQACGSEEDDGVEGDGFDSDEPLPIVVTSKNYSRCYKQIYMAFNKMDTRFIIL